MDFTGLDLIEIKPGIVGIEYFNTNLTKRGKIMTSWNGKAEKEDKGPHVNWDAALLDEHDKHLIMVKAHNYGLSRHVSYTRKQMRKIEKINAKIAESKKEAKGRK